MEGRSGTLWEGRYKSSPVDTESYLLECSRYIELNPLRAGIVGRPEQYRWSSFGAKAAYGKTAASIWILAIWRWARPSSKGKVAMRRLCHEVFDHQS